MAQVWLNGRLTANPMISADDRGFLLGDGLFETLRVYAGVPFRLGRHLERLDGGCRRVGIPFPTALPETVSQVLAANPRLLDAALRITVTRGSGRGLWPSTEAVPTVLVSLSPYTPDPAWYREGVSAQIADGRLDENGPLVGLKHLGYLPSILALRNAAKEGADEAILLNRAGFVAEASASNLFCVMEGALLTPPLSAGILPGITREVILKVARSTGDPAQEADITLPGLQRAEEIFLTSSLREMAPVTQLDGVPVGTGAPGPVCEALSEAYREIVATVATNPPVARAPRKPHPPRRG